MKIFAILLFALLWLDAGIVSIASIAPVTQMVDAIASERVETITMVMQGDSPHTYEPKPSQMKAVSEASLYFAIGVEFEKAWLARFKAQNSSMRVVNLYEGIKRLHMKSHHEHDAKGGEDPHIWTAPRNMIVMAKKVAKALEDIDPEGRKYYEKNLQKYIAQVEALEKRISSILSSLPAGSSFLVFHPSWGYFADEFGLKQVAMETEGKEPSAKEFMSLIKRMKKSGARAIVVQPEFSNKSARLLAKELSIPVVAVSPLAYDWQNSLLRVARAIAGREN